LVSSRQRPTWPSTGTPARRRAAARSPGLKMERSMPVWMTEDRGSRPPRSIVLRALDPCRDGVHVQSTRAIDPALHLPILCRAVGWDAGVDREVGTLPAASLPPIAPEGVSTVALMVQASRSDRTKGTRAEKRGKVRESRKYPLPVLPWRLCA